MGAEGDDGAPDRFDTFGGEQPGTVGTQRCDDDVEISCDLVGCRVRGEVAMGERPGDVVEHGCCHCPDAGMDTTERPAVRLVRAERRIVLGRVGQGLQRRERCDQTGRHRQLARELVKTGEVVFVGEAGLHLDCEPQDVGRHERISVAIATDPGTHRDHTRIGDFDAQAGRDELLDIALEAGDGLEDARPIVPKGLVDLVAHAQLRQAHLGRLPQGQHLEAEVVIDLVDLTAAVGSMGTSRQEVGDLVDVVENGLAPDLGRVCRDHRGDPQLGEFVDDPIGRHAVGEQAVEPGFEAALLPAGTAVAVEASAPLGVEILGGVGEQ